MTTSTYALDSTWRTLLLDLKVSPADVLRRAGLPDDLLDRNEVRLATTEYYKLWCAIEKEVGGAPLALRVCEAVRSESFSPVLFAALCSPNLLVAAQRVAHYKALVGPIRMDIHHSGQGLALEFGWPDQAQPPDSFAIMELLFCVTLARIGTRAAIQPICITTPNPPTTMAPYEAFLGTIISAGAKHSVTFSSADAALPFLTSNDALWKIFEPQLRQRLIDLKADTPTSIRIRAALLESLPSGQLSISDVAQKLCISKRTLQRKLESEGTNFQTLLNDTRKNLAQHYLEKTTLAHGEIAFLLGFDETNSFYRAVKGWTGATPDDIRQRRKTLRG